MSDWFIQGHQGKEGTKMTWQRSPARWLLLALAAVVVTALAVACNDDGEETEASPEPQVTEAASPTQAAPPETLKIGVNLELSGAYEVAIKPYYQGMQLAVADINDAGGLEVDGKRYVLELVVRDAQLDPTVAAANATELIRDEGVKFIFGPLSEVFMATYPIATENKVWTATQSIGIQGSLINDPLSANPNVFISTAKYDDTFGAAAAALRSFVPESEGNTVALLNEDSPSGQLFTEVLRRAAENNGFEVVADESFPFESPDFNTILTRVKAANPDFIWSSTVFHAVPMLKAAEELEVTNFYMTTVIDPQVPLAAAVGGPISHPLYIVNNAPWFGDLATSADRAAFGDRATAAAGEPIISQFHFTYDAGYYGVQSLANAIEKAGTVDDVDAISLALEGSTVDGPVGTAVVEGHFVSLPMELAEIKDGQISQVCYYPDFADVSVNECVTPTP